MARLLFRAISTAAICAAVLSSAPLFERAAYGADTWKFYFHQTTFFLGSARGAKMVEILNPYVEKAYAQKGSVLLGSYTYPSQVVWTARKKIGSLEDISGLKLRVSNPEQGEFLRRFHGTSITMGAPQVPAALD